MSKHTKSTGYSPVVMMLLPQFGQGGTAECMKHYVVLDGAPSAHEGWEMLPNLAAERGFTRVAHEGAYGRGGWSNVYLDHEGRRYVGYWTSTEVAASDVAIFSPSTNLPTKQYRRWKVLTALRILRAAGYPLARVSA